jgi:hypothetical protein
MRKITTGIALSLAAALWAGSLSAAAAPAKTIIEDPVGDANFVNDQGTGDGTFGDFTQADAGTVSDLTEISLSNDAKNLTVTIGTEAAPPAATPIGYRVRFNPDDAGTHCIIIEAYHPNTAGAMTAVAQFRDVCEGGDPVEVELLGTTIIVPRKVSKAFAKGATLKAPQAQAFLHSGAGVLQSGPVADTTLVGTDYKFKK